MKNKIIVLCLIFSVCVARPPSLVNPGVRCYSNAVTQALYNIAPFTDVLIAHKNEFSDDHDPLIASYINLISSFQTGINIEKDLEIFNGIIAAKLVCPKREKEAKDEQQDAAQMLSTIFSYLFNAKTPDNVYKKLNELIDAGDQSVIKCPATEHNVEYEVQIPPEGLRLLIVPILSMNTLGQCLNAFFAPEPVEYDGECMKQLKLERASPYLIIQLKRYQEIIDPKDPKKRILEKDTHVVAIPEILEFSNIPNSNIKNMYTLIGAIVHGGGLTGGHYTAYIQDQYELRQGKAQWYHCNDSIITELGVDITSFQANINNGYIFFYRRLDYVDPYREQPQEAKKDNLGESLNRLSADLMSLAAVLA